MVSNADRLGVLAAKLATSRRSIEADEIVRSIWQAAVNGEISIEEADRITQAAKVNRPPTRSPAPSLLILNTRPAPRSPDRQRSIDRRRALASSGAVPSSIAGPFTTGELAALAIIAFEVRRSKGCRLSNAEIAGRAGVSRTVVQTTLRKAKAVGLIAVRLRPRHGRKNLPNIVTIQDHEWLSWIKRRRRRPASVPP